MRTYKLVLFLMLGLSIFTSCENDLDVTLEDDDELTSDDLFTSPEAYRQALAGVYGNLSFPGILGPDNDPNLAGIDGGTSQYIRGLFNLENLSTDEAIWSYENDPGLRGMQRNTWGSDNPLILGVFARAGYELSLANEFLRQTTPEVLDGRDVSESLRTEIRTYRAEARALRALAYYHFMDLFGKAPFYTENDAVGFVQAEEINRQELFTFIEGELLEIINDLAPALQNEYGRVDQGMARMLLAKIYLNAEVYTGEARYADCLAQCEQIIASGYTLTPNYLNNFMADNNTNGAQNEIIFPIINDGSFAQNYGGTTILIQGEVGNPEANGESLGVNPTGFGGLFRVRSQFSRRFTDNPIFENDSRNTLLTEDRPIAISDVGNTAQGYIIAKYSNRTSDGGFGSDRTFTDTDFPLFRYADVLLMYAEAHLRGGGGNRATALEYINALRTRAFGNSSGNISDGDLTLNFLIDERSRELYWECVRRQDLIRFGLYSGGQYNWSYKGGPQSGTSIPEFRELFPIPDQSLSSNSNLTQNPGY
ncbi:RagB/SusD family nutrient uptake outer membrane protein [Flavimarina sp. Hel_I_48]|uniref:RagB/SusD family nutrient uptake outer membrane protein n=1 Tax=Flavimarina sp. Hel_I_48 TaxID=1392488 RepID=UPI0004DF8ECF|nr:RagB/SusD family nutrient uptake outer membrane protein [Flavimarina sp. Hel_I_48]